MKHSKTLKNCRSCSHQQITLPPVGQGRALALQGPGPVAEEPVRAGARRGHWVALSVAGALAAPATGSRHQRISGAFLTTMDRGASGGARDASISNFGESFMQQRYIKTKKM
jgi:hypothetical protein